MILSDQARASWVKSFLQPDGAEAGEQLRNNIWPKSVPLWMAAFYLALFILRPWEELLPWLGEIRFEKIYALLMLTVVLLSNRKNLQFGSQSAIVLIFLFGLSLSAVLAVNPSLAWDPLYSYITIVIFYFVVLAVIRTPYELVFVVICYITAMGVYLLKSQWEFFLNGQHRYDMGVVRLVGIESSYGGPNNLAMSIVVSMPFLLFLWMHRREVSEAWPALWKKWFPRLLVCYAWLALSSVILTNSRSGMLSFVVFVFLSIFRGRSLGRSLRYLIGGALILSVAWLLMPEGNKARFHTIWAPEEGPQSAEVSAQGRIEGYKAGMTMFERFPATGVGIGNFIFYRERYVDGVPLNAHNLVGQIFGETGLVGASTFLFLVISILLNCRRLKRSAKTVQDPLLAVLSSFGQACRNSLLLMFFTGMFGHNLFRFNWLWLAAFSSLALTLKRRQLERRGLVS